MDKLRFKYLYERYLSGTLLAAERQEWKEGLSDKEFLAELEQVSQELWEREDLPVPIYNKLHAAQIYHEIIEHGVDLAQVEPVKGRRQALWPRVAVAASIALFLNIGAYFYFKQPSIIPQNSSYVNDVAPGKLGATLTLASGKQIRLADADNGELAKEAGVVITKTADGKLVYELKAADGGTNQVNTISTSRGETYQLRLPDGTWVWLNAASSLTYAANLKDGAHAGQRRVSLVGEAYFEVAKDKIRPFLVKSDRQSVEVLGTHFNVNAYSDEPVIRTTLLEGSVRLNSSTVLRPGEQGELLASGKIAVEKTDLDEAVAWKNGKFIFDNEDMERIMRKLSRWYDVEVIFQGDLKGRTFDGSISRYDSIAKVLDKITFTNAVHFKIEGRRVTVMP